MGWIKEKYNSDGIFYLVSVLFAFVFCFAVRARDDIGTNLLENGTLCGYWQKSAGLYQTWSSRVLINFLIFIFTDHVLAVWAFFMGVSMFVLLKAFSILLAGDGRGHGDRKSGHVIACLVMLYPFQDLSSAGWISTMTTYFSPIAFGFMSLVPIQKRKQGEGLRRWEYAAYALCLLFGADNEQMMVVLAACYLVAVLYFAVQRTVSRYVVFLFLLAVGRGFLTMFCPGNQVRKQAEVAAWFPSYGMLNIVDKADLGLFTTLEWIFLDCHVFTVVICIGLACLVWRKYRDWTIRMICLFPAAVSVFLYPVFHLLSVGGVSYYGLVTAENRGGWRAFSLYFVLSFAAAVVCLELFLLLDDLWDLLGALVLLAAGMASRAAMGFSPTIYASGPRTCSVLGFCMIAAGLFVLFGNVPPRVWQGGRARWVYALDVVVLGAFLKLWGYVLSGVL